MIKLYFFLLAGLSLHSSAMVPAAEDQNKVLFDAIEQDNLEGVKKALDAGAKIEAQEPIYKMTPLIKAAEKGNLEIVKYLLSKKANIKALSTSNMTALHWAAARDVKPELIELLIKAGIPVNVVNDEGATPLDGVTTIPVARVLLEHGVDINQKNNNGKTALLQVIIFSPLTSGNRTIDLVKFLLEQGTDPLIKDANGKSALDFAAKIEKPEVKSQVTDLLKKFIENRDPLFDAVKKHDIDAVKKLAQKISVNIKDNRGNTPLHYAVHDGDEEMIKFLLSIKANSNIKNRAGETPLNWAAYGDPRILQIFIKSVHAPKIQK